MTSLTWVTSATLDLRSRKSSLRNLDPGSALSLEPKELRSWVNLGWRRTGMKDDIRVLENYDQDSRSNASWASEEKSRESYAMEHQHTENAGKVDMTCQSALFPALNDLTPRKGKFRGLAKKRWQLALNTVQRELRDGTVADSDMPLDHRSMTLSRTSSNSTLKSIVNGNDNDMSSHPIKKLQSEFEYYATEWNGGYSVLPSLKPIVCDYKFMQCTPSHEVRSYLLVCTSTYAPSAQERMWPEEPRKAADEALVLCEARTAQKESKNRIRTDWHVSFVRRSVSLQVTSAEGRQEHCELFY